ncbi:MAG: hypothetical protein GWN00_00620 [Aliifodinibius sp.]|nr:hypothetical protein [Fodinibius sp.]NIW96692.1 hypothetical protein [Phycisphaerae bacterium]NIY23368.1 hypothetical protein [Fodinibius sp.]
MDWNRRIEKPPGTLWAKEVQRLYGVRVGTLKAWRLKAFGPKPIRVGKRLVVYDAQECREFFETYKFKSSRPPIEDRDGMDVTEIADALGENDYEKVHLWVKQAKEKFRTHWAWFKCLVRHGLSPDEAVIFLKHSKKTALLEPLLIKDDYEVNWNIVDMFDHEFRIRSVRGVLSMPFFSRLYYGGYNLGSLTDSGFFCIKISNKRGG